jgi:hypothetical protein
MTKIVVFRNSAHAPNKQQYGHGMILFDEESSVDQSENTETYINNALDRHDHTALVRD